MCKCLNKNTLFVVFLDNAKLKVKICPSTHPQWQKLLTVQILLVCGKQLHNCIISMTKREVVLALKTSFVQLLFVEMPLQIAVYCINLR